MVWQMRALFRAGWAWSWRRGCRFPALRRKLSAPVDGRIKTLTQAYNELGQQLFEQFTASPCNVVFSPYSIGAATAMALAGARGATETECRPQRINPATALERF